MDLINKMVFGTQANRFETILNDEIGTENDALKQAKLDKIEKNEKPYPIDLQNLHLFMRDCLEETPEHVKGKVSGEIPSWLSGSLIRNGPGKRTFGESKTQHAFDSAALLRKFSIKNGKVTFQAKFLKSDMYTRNTQAQRIVMGEFGTAATPDPCKSIFQRFASAFADGDPTDNCLVHVCPFNDEIYAMTETTILHRVNPQSLDAMRRVNLKDYVSVVHHTAHPHMDPDGTVYGLGMTTGKGGVEYAVVEFPNTKRGAIKAEDVFAEGRIAARVPTRWRFSPCYMHSYGLSPNYFVIIEQPVGISLISRMFGKILKSTFADALKCYDDPTLIHVLSRETGTLVRTYEAEPFFYFHTINQFEEEGQVVIDICCYKDFTGFSTLMDHTLNNFQKDPNFADMFRGRPARFVCPLDPPRKEGNLVTLKGSNAKAEWSENKIQVTGETLLNKSCEMPRINYDFNGKSYRYFYCFSGDIDDDYPLAIKKVDIETKTALAWSEEGVYPSEPVFVPRPHATEEDDGVVLSSLLYADNDKAVSLLVLDGKTLKELGRADFEAAGAVPAGFHGWFLGEDFINKHAE